MAVISWTDVLAIAPTLTIPTAAQTLILAQVTRQVGSVQWGDWQADGQLYLAAHLGTVALRGTGGVSGQVTSETVGQVSRTFSTTSLAAAGDTSTTSYGVEYARIRALLPTRFGLLA